MAVEGSSTIATVYALLESAELWEELDEQWKATGTGLIYRKRDGHLYYAWSPMTFRDYRKPDEIPVNSITKEVLIPSEAYSPPYELSYAQALVITDDVFVKTHPLKSYDWLNNDENKSDICKTVLREAAFCEQIKRRAHPNLAEYMGCQVTEGRISGLCFRKYKHTLQQVFNPGHHEKRAVPSPGWSEDQIAHCLDPIESAVRHLHSMQIAHNDVNPANIMFDHDGNPVLIDFGSCCEIGLSLEDIGRTYEWHDERVNKSLPSNDLDAIREMREWLGTKDPKNFLF